ncbi:hypothetical protein B7Y94_00755 [Candidatus Saccharibacteria bacterium 32-49-12]|nr:MAG: hypothetical protein B7Y94_00755 [Candidatus Saccharibacteria bacterium 32-49-12]
MNIFFSGIGGVGIGPLAEIAHDMGHQVAGSDMYDSLTTAELRRVGIDVHIGQDGSFLEDSHNHTNIDWYVYTAALPADHPELTKARQLGIHTAKRDELLAHLIKEKDLKLIAISGTHGKTTTTGMAVWTLQQLGVPVSYSVGSTLSFGPSGHYDTDSEYFVYECDEFDRNFLHFQPHLSLLTAVDYDHPDTYPTEESYIEAFQTFINQSADTILWRRDADYLSVDDHSGIQILDESYTYNFDLPGDHNRRNATLVLEACRQLGLASDNRIIDSLNNFPGTDRRFQKLADNLFSDYGHHPKEIVATLQLAREVANKIALVYQPHQNIRQHELLGQYKDEFNQADVVYWLPTYLSRENPDLEILSPEQLIASIPQRDHIKIADLDNDLWAEIQKLRQRDYLVLCMGAGTIDGWVRQKLAEPTA